MLRLKLQIEEFGTFIDLPEEIGGSDILKVELESLKDKLATKIVSNEALAREGVMLRAEVLILRERNKTAIGRCAAKQNENDSLCNMHTSQRMEIEIYDKQIKEARTANKVLKADKDKLRQKLYVKYYPTDGQIKAEKERDYLQTKLDILEARKAEAIEHLRL
jgi:regulator of replication initiation timing